MLTRARSDETGVAEERAGAGIFLSIRLSLITRIRKQLKNEELSQLTPHPCLHLEEEL